MILFQIPTLKNFRRLLEILNKDGISHLHTRRVNQDPLENFFGSIRGHGGYNSKPTPMHFVGAYKTLLIGAMSSRHSPGANCEEDEAVNLTGDIETIILKSMSKEQPIIENNQLQISTEEHIIDVPETIDFLERYTLQKVSIFLNKLYYFCFV